MKGYLIHDARDRRSRLLGGRLLRGAAREERAVPALQAIIKPRHRRAHSVPYCRTAAADASERRDNIITHTLTHTHTRQQKKTSAEVDG